MSALHAHQDKNITSFFLAWLIDVRPFNRAALLHMVYSLPQRMIGGRSGGGWLVSIWILYGCVHVQAQLPPHIAVLQCCKLLHPTPDRSCIICLLTMRLFLSPHDALLSCYALEQEQSSCRRYAHRRLATPRACDVHSKLTSQGPELQATHISQVRWDGHRLMAVGRSRWAARC